MSAPRNLRPLSQSGWIRIPTNPRQRVTYPVARERTALDARNEILADEERPRVLHATKGFRPLSAKRSKAAMITASIRAGQFPWSMKAIRRELKGVAP